MKIFRPSPEALITAKLLPQIQPTSDIPEIKVTVAPAHSPNAGLFQAYGPGVAALLIDEKGQPRGLPILNSRNPQPGLSLIDSALVTPIMQHTERSLNNRSPWYFAFNQLSWMPHTDFSSRVCLNVYARISLKAIDWLIYSAGLVIGIAALPTIYPIIRCVKTYKAVISLQDGMADLQLAHQLLQTARTLPNITVVEAQSILRVYRGQACRPRMLSVIHRSGWSSLAEGEMMRHLDAKIPGFSLKLRAQDVQDNHNAMMLKFGVHAMIVATQPAPKHHTHVGKNSHTEQHEYETQWSKYARIALAASAHL